MQITHFWNQFHLQSKKTCVVALFAFIFFELIAFSSQAQWIGHRSNKGGSKYDEYATTALKRRRLDKRLHFGLFLAPVRTQGSIKMTDEFTYSSPNSLDGLVNVHTKGAGGFALGFYSNIRISEFWDFRIAVSTAFLERQLEYVYQDGSLTPKVIESTLFELPMHFKYRSQLRGTKGMYLLAGIKPAFALSTKQKDEATIRTNNSDFSVEYGLGMDVFFPYFKFAPELRFSHGLINVLDTSSPNEFSKHLKRLSTHTVTLYVHFGG